MTASATTQEAAQKHYLATGEHDALFRSWPGDNVFDAARKGDAALRSILIAEVRSRGTHSNRTPALQAFDVVALTRGKVTPMVTGLFPQHERAVVLAMLERSVVFPVPQNIESVLRSMPWLHTAWSLANLYLASACPALLSPEASPIVGLSHETTCCMSEGREPCWRTSGRLVDDGGYGWLYVCERIPTADRVLSDLSNLPTFHLLSLLQRVGVANATVASEEFHAREPISRANNCSTPKKGPAALRIGYTVGVTCHARWLCWGDN